MRTVSRWTLFVALWLPLCGAAQAKLSVVATTPELGAVAHAVGGDSVTVTTLAKSTEDPHFVDARPSHIVTLNRADALIEGGADLETGWLPPLIDGARNAKILPGAPGRIVASEGIALLDIPANADRSKGDIHAAGNPHFMMDPMNALIVARHIATAFCAIDSAGCAGYKSNFNNFQTRLNVKLAEWTNALAPYAQREIVTYHATWRYFSARFGLVTELYLEPKPGIPPSPPHLAQVIATMNERNIKVILVEPYQPRKVADTVAAHTSAVVVPVAQFPGALPNTEADYLALIDADVAAIATALKGAS